MASIVQFFRRMFGLSAPEPAERILVDREGVAYLPSGRPIVLKGRPTRA